MDDLVPILSRDMGPPSVSSGGGGAPHVRILKTLKRNREEKENTRKQVKLESVLGVTVSSNASLATAPVTGTIAYTAGCTVVLYNCDNTNQQQHIINMSKKPITCVGWSDDGCYLVTGEAGHLPCVRVWDILTMSCIGEFSSHKFGINCVAFSPNIKYIVSVGTEHDMIVNVWDWRSGIKVASNKISSKVKAVSFTKDGSYFVTAGNRHVKFWYFDTKSAKLKDCAAPLLGRSAILGEQRNNMFCDVSCGKGEMTEFTFTITKSGLLCQFNKERLLDKWVELKTNRASCLSVGEHYIMVGCSDGIVRCFSPHTLQFLVTLPKPHVLGLDVAQAVFLSDSRTQHRESEHPDAIAVSYDELNDKVTVVYNDHSMYVWDIKNLRKVAKICSFLFHSACIWGVEFHNQKMGKLSVLPKGSFVTCSSDDTIRIWNLKNKISSNTTGKKNVTKDLLKIVYIDPLLTFIKKPDSFTSQESLFDQKNGVRCISISPDGAHLASGDRAGNIRVHDLQSMVEVCKIEAHDAEVLTVQYSQEGGTGGYLASASRDRLIHVFDVHKNYEFLSTLDDHSASITAVRFLPTENGDGVQMVSCGADKSIIFRNIKTDQEGISLLRSKHIVGKTTFFDMEVDKAGKQILTACQDRNIRVYSVGGVKQSSARVLRGSASEDGSLIKVVMDRSGSYYATSCTDKTIAVYDYLSGDLMATLSGHSELVTGLAFSHDSHHLISVSGDSCVFVWRLPKEMVVTMRGRLDTIDPDETVETIEDFVDVDNEEFGSPPPELLHLNELDIPDDAAYRFSVGKLPAWAKKKVVKTLSPAEVNCKQLGVSRGKWANRQSGGMFKFPDSICPDLEDESGDSYDTLQGYPRKTLFEGADVTTSVCDDEVVNEFTVNAMDVSELRKSHRKYKVSKKIRNESMSDDEDDEVMETLSYQIPGELVEIENQDESELDIQSNFDALYHEEGMIAYKSSSISNAWREGNTPVQLKRKTRNLQKILVGNKLNILKSSQSIDNLNTIPGQSLKWNSKLDSELTSPSPHNPIRKSSTPEGTSFLQKACSMLDISSADTPQRKINSSLRRRGSCDSELSEENVSSSLNISDNTGTKDSPTAVSRLEQHKKMLANLKKDRVEASKKPTNKKDTVIHDVPSYMRLTVAKSNKEKLSNIVIKKSKSLGEQSVPVKASKLKLKIAEECSEIIQEDKVIELNSEDENKKKELAIDEKLRKLKPVQQAFVPAEVDILDVAKAHIITKELIKSCATKIQTAADQLVLVYKRVSLDDDLHDSLRAELLGQLSEGAFQAAGTLKLVTREDDRSQGEIATAAMATINQFLAKQGNTPTRARSNRHFQDLVGNLTNEEDVEMRLISKLV